MADKKIKEISPEQLLAEIEKENKELHNTSDNEAQDKGDNLETVKEEEEK